MRMLVVVLLMIGLAACNPIGVTSETPLFDTRDEAGAARLKDGVWLQETENCAVNTRRPVYRWPDCARWRLVRGRESLFLGDAWATDEETGRKIPNPKREWGSDTYVLVAGKPRILQASGWRNPWEATPEDPEILSDPTGYWVVDETVHDPQGRITAYDIWPVDCAIAPPPNVFFSLPRGETDDRLSMSLQADHPTSTRPFFEGFGEGRHVRCTTNSAQAVRNAASSLLRSHRENIRILHQEKTLKAQAKAAGFGQDEIATNLMLAKAVETPQVGRWIREPTARDFPSR
jgi:hypothetical protein